MTVTTARMSLASRGNGHILDITSDVACEQLRANVVRAWRTTTGTNPRLWVYGRAGEP